MSLLLECVHGALMCFQELLGVLRHGWGRPHGRVGASVPLPRLHQVGAPGLPAALGRREAAGQQHGSRGLPAVQCWIPHCLPQAGWVNSQVDLNPGSRGEPEKLWWLRVFSDLCLTKRDGSAELIRYFFSKRLLPKTRNVNFRFPVRFRIVHVETQRLN